MSANEHFPGNALLDLLDASPNAVVGVNPSGLVAYLNPAASAEFGYEREDLAAAPIEVLLPAHQMAAHAAHRAAFAQHPVARPMGIGLELAGRRKDGTEFPVEIGLTPIEAAGGIWIFATIVDISARVQADREIRALSRAYRIVAETNKAILRAPDENALFNAVCQIAVEQGGALGAWVGVATSARGEIREVASAGTISAYIAQLTISATPSTPQGRGPTAQALREGKPVYCDDFQSDPTTEPWRELGRYYGIRASACLPLRRGAETVAVLSIYAETPNSYDEPLRSLLEGLTDDVSFALARLQPGSG